jgi:hypothetical protein
MATITLVTSVYLSKAEALAVLEEALDAPSNTDDPADVSVSLGHGATLTIEVPKFGEDLPLTLDIHHEDDEALRATVDDVSDRIVTSLGWSLHEIS